MKTFEKKSKMTTPPVCRGRTPVIPSFNPAAQIQRAQIRQVLCSPQVQAKLTIGQPNDKYEQEADHVADEVMRMPEPGVQRQVDPEEEEEAAAQPKMLQRQAEEEEEPVQTKPKEEAVQAKNIGSKSGRIAPNIESGINSMRGGGQCLTRSTRAFFEPRFGVDFSGVRVHDDSNASHLAKSVHAKAFTVGKDVVFGIGQYAPETSGGKQLLAHELTHVM